MKITIWIRPGKDGHGATERIDYKLESYDTPRVQNFGFRLIKAMQGENAGMKGSPC